MVQYCSHFWRLQNKLDLGHFKTKILQNLIFFCICTYTNIVPPDVTYNNPTQKRQNPDTILRNLLQPGGNDLKYLSYKWQGIFIGK